jgi:hypothetical protein
MRKVKCYLWAVHVNKCGRTLVVMVAATVFIILSLSEPSFAQNYEQQYLFQSGESTYQLTVTITPSLYEYYQQKSHYATTNNLDTFVTPYALALVAADIRTVYHLEEDFVNAVLMMVHQIPYEVVAEPKFPVETMVENQGDCDLLSYIASSLIRAQDLNVVLLYYEAESHMNIGVSLPNPPRDARTTVTYVDYGGSRYYMAECTGNDWQNGWRVGEMPPDLDGAQVAVIPIDNAEATAPGQVSSSFGSMQASTISLTVSSFMLLEGSSVTLTGEVSIPNAQGTVSLYGTTSSNWVLLGTAQLDSNGRYSFSMKPTQWGQIHVKASWPGDDEYAGADSNSVSIYVLPQFLVPALAGLLVMTIMVVIILVIYRTTHPRETQPIENSPGLYTESLKRQHVLGILEPRPTDF